MDNYKADITLNEKDSLQDMLNLEKEMVKMYSTALTEGVRKGFRERVSQFFDEQAKSQFDIYMLMTELDYASVTSAPEEILSEQKQKFSQIQDQLY